MFRNLWENIRKEMPKKGRGKGEDLDPLKLPTRAADGAGSALRPLREDLQALGEAGHQGAALLHHRLPEHRHLEAGLRLHLRLSPEERGRHNDAGERPARTVPQFRRDHGNPLPARTRCSSTASSSNPAMRSTTISATWLPTRSSASAARSSSEPATREPAENITDQELLREVMNTVGKPGQLGGSSAASSPSPCSPRAGMPTPSPTFSAFAPSARSFSASRSSAARCAASPTT